MIDIGLLSLEWVGLKKDLTILHFMIFPKQLNAAGITPAAFV